MDWDPSDCDATQFVTYLNSRATRAHSLPFSNSDPIPVTMYYQRIYSTVLQIRGLLHPTPSPVTVRYAVSPFLVPSTLSPVVCPVCRTVKHMAHFPLYPAILKNALFFFVWLFSPVKRGLRGLSNHPLCRKLDNYLLLIAHIFFTQGLRDSLFKLPVSPQVDAN
jgi:hypothetical protein